MKAVASRVTEKGDVLLLQAVDMDDSGPYEVADPRNITALETYCPSYLQTPKLRRLADIVSAQAQARAVEELEEQDVTNPPTPTTETDVNTLVEEPEPEEALA